MGHRVNMGVTGSHFEDSKKGGVTGSHYEDS